MIPSAQPFSFPTAAPQATIYQTNGVLFYLGATETVNRTQIAGTLGTSYILFGRNYNHQNKFPPIIDLSSVASREFVSEVNNVNNRGTGGGIRNDITTRSTTVVGDINGDGFLDLLVGYPMVSKCSVYLGNGVDDFTTIIATTGESFAIIGDPYHGEGFLGWSSIRIGDLNGDGCDEMVVSAISSNMIYVIYGSRDFNSRHLNITELALKDGLMKIIGNPLEINFGVSLTLLHQFRKGSHADLAVTAQQLTAGQNTIYILFGSAVFKDFKKNIEIAEIMNNPFYCFRIIAPAFSYAGFSVAGIGDINSDGYDDLAIGSLPYTRGGFSTQRTYVTYGRKEVVSSKNELYLSSISEDGFIIEGGGFLVTGIGDINSDGVADMMITRYDDWKGHGAAYLISTPANITYSPSVQPSSFPTITRTSLPTSIHDIVFENSTVLSNLSVPSIPPSFRPTRIPSLRPVDNPTIAPTRLLLAVGTARPSVGKPSLSPSLTPTTGYHRLRGSSPSILPTIMPTINTTVYTEIECPGEDDDDQQDRQSSEYHGKNGTPNLFRITANSGIVKLTGNNEGGAKNIYVLQFCPPDRLDVVISNFRLSTDIISVFHLSEAGYSNPALSSIAYSNRKGPLTLLFCSENKLQVILSSHATFDLQEPNFLFTQINGIDSDGAAADKETILNRVQVGVVAGVFVFLILVFSALSYQNKQEEKEREKHEQWLLSRSAVCIEEDREQLHNARTDIQKAHESILKLEDQVDLNASPEVEQVINSDQSELQDDPLSSLLSESPQIRDSVDLRIQLRDYERLLIDRDPIHEDKQSSSSGDSVVLASSSSGSGSSSESDEGSDDEDWEGNSDFFAEDFSELEIDGRDDEEEILDRERTHSLESQLSGRNEKQKPNSQSFQTKPPLIPADYESLTSIAREEEEPESRNSDDWEHALAFSDDEEELDDGEDNNYLTFNFRVNNFPAGVSGMNPRIVSNINTNNNIINRTNPSSGSIEEDLTSLNSENSVFQDEEY
jgi:hypothetical protein